MPPLKIHDRVYMVGSGAIGLSDAADCHVYLIDGGKELALVDAGGGKEVEPILENIRSCGFSLEQVGTILLTHSHMDHAAGSLALKSKLEEAGARVKLAASAKEADILAGGTSQELGLDLLGHAGKSRNEVFPPFCVDLRLQDGAELNLGDLRIKMIEVPGHNPGCMCFLVDLHDGKRFLFAGDVISMGGVISLGNWVGSNLQDYRSGLRKLSGLHIDGLLPGHFLFTIRNGQVHIDRALHAFDGLFPPPNVSQIP